MKPICKALLLSSACLLAAAGNAARAEMTPVVECEGNGDGGWVTSSRGLRFTAERDFSVINLRMEGRAAGRHEFTIELRRSAGFTDTVERTVSGVAFNARGDISTFPYRNVVVPIGHVPVHGIETFSLRFVQTDGDDRAYFEASLSSLDCGADVLDNNTVADPTVLGSPTGFRVFGELDSDLDGLSDVVDNCINEFNPDQRDTDGDGLGNACDADLDGNCEVNFSDLGLLKAAFFQTGPGLDADLDGDEAVNFTDLGRMKAAFFAEPGPSEQPNACAAESAYSTGSFQLSGTWSFDLETGTTPFGLAPTDVFNRRDSSSEAYWDPRNNALLASWGPTAPTRAQCAGAPLSSDWIDLSTQAVGDWVCVQTNEGRLARFRVTGANSLPLSTAGLFEIEYLTWD